MTLGFQKIASTMDDTLLYADDEGLLEGFTRGCKFRISKFRDGESMLEFRYCKGTLHEKNQLEHSFSNYRTTFFCIHFQVRDDSLIKTF